MAATSAASAPINVAENAAIVDPAVVTIEDGADETTAMLVQFEEWAKGYDIPKDVDYKFGEDIKFTDATKKIIKRLGRTRDIVPCNNESSDQF